MGHDGCLAIHKNISDRCNPCGACSKCSTTAKKWNINALLLSTAFVSMIIGTNSFAVAPYSTSRYHVSPSRIFFKNEATRTARRCTPIYGLEQFAQPRDLPFLTTPPCSSEPRGRRRGCGQQGLHTMPRNIDPQLARVSGSPDQGAPHRAPSASPQADPPLAPRARRARRRS